MLKYIPANPRNRQPKPTKEITHASLYHKVENEPDVAEAEHSIANL